MSSAIKQLLRTYFNDSVEDAVVAIIRTKNNLSDEDFNRLTGLIAEAKAK